MSDAELRAESEKFHAIKAWCSRQVAVDAEIARRATDKWRKEDVFGHTFGPA